MVEFCGMRPGISKIAASVVLLVCLVCAVSETLDRWDNSFQTGNEAESSILILALCLGTAYLIVKASFGVVLNWSSTVAASNNLSSEASCRLSLGLSSASDIPGSPPMLPLRI